jgi:hypothetical protein
LDLPSAVTAHRVCVRGALVDNLVVERVNNLAPSIALCARSAPARRVVIARARPRTPAHTVALAIDIVVVAVVSKPRPFVRTRAAKCGAKGAKVVKNIYEYSTRHRTFSRAPWRRTRERAWRCPARCIARVDTRE